MKIFLFSYPVYTETTEDEALLLIIMLITYSFNSHFQMDQSEVTPALLFIMSHLDDEVKPNMLSTFFHLYLFYTFNQSQQSI